MICQKIFVSGDQLRFLSTKSHSIRSMKVIKYKNKDSFKPFKWGGGGVGGEEMTFATDKYRK